MDYLLLNCGNESLSLRNELQTNQNQAGIFIYSIELQLNLCEFDSDYPREPKTLGEMIRKARLDKGMQAKELAKLIGVTSETIHNWEIHGRIPTS